MNWPRTASFATDRVRKELFSIRRGATAGALADAGEQRIDARARCRISLRSSRWVVSPPRPAVRQREISIFEALVRLIVLERKGVTGVKMLCTVTSTELSGSL